MSIAYYKAIRADETVAAAGDIIRVDWDEYSDGTPAKNLSQGYRYCPFRTRDQDGEIMVQITEEQAQATLVGIRMEA